MSLPSESAPREPLPLALRAAAVATDPAAAPIYLEGTVSKSEYRERSLELRQDLLACQAELLRSDFAVLLLFSGVDAAGKGETSNLLSSWMDPRGIVTHAYARPSTEEAERPPMWRFWRDLPAHGSIGIYLSAWYHDPLLDAVYEKVAEGELERHLERINAFERALVSDETLVIKIWMHMDKETQEQRLRALESDPLRSWRVSPKDWRHWHLYERFVETSARLLGGTSTPEAPWAIVNCADEGFRDLAVGQTLLRRVQDHLEKRAASRKSSPRVEKRPESEAHASVFANLDMSSRLAKKEYREELASWQARLNTLHRRAKAAGIATVIAFEGWDASGKGGAIRRLAAALEARDYRIRTVGPPTQEESSRHYLWRFWRWLPAAGRVTIFDRSWYGRVLVERIEAFATTEEWERAYDEINEFEAQLADHGTVLVKLWMHVTEDEQKRRFHDRRNTPHKRWKLTKEDWRNRSRWEDYERAVDEMVARTDRDRAPWTLVEGNDKRFARIKVLKTVCERLRAALD